MKRHSFRRSRFPLLSVQPVAQQKKNHPISIVAATLSIAPAVLIFGTTSILASKQFPSTQTLIVGDVPQPSAIVLQKSSVALQKSSVPHPKNQEWDRTHLEDYKWDRTLLEDYIGVSSILTQKSSVIYPKKQEWDRTLLKDYTSVRSTDVVARKRKKVIQSASPNQAFGSLAVDLSTRQNSLDFYTANYVNRDDTTMDWSGDQSSCTAGDVSGTFRNQYIHRINYFRAMAGVPANVVLEASYNQKAQQAALMMSANNQLSHSPDSSWKCYTEAGKDAAGSSNLFLGVAGVGSVDGYIMDPGDRNGHVGHRRWLLHPATQKMGIGSVADKGEFRKANALWVSDSPVLDSRLATRDEFVAWPPPGFVPYQVTFARWSFAYPDADFSDASVSMTSNDSVVSVSVEPIINGAGENTFVWKAMGLADSAKWPQPVEDTPYTVTIRDVRIDGQARDFTYTVTIFDPTAVATAPSTEVSFRAAAPDSHLTVNDDGIAADYF